MPLSTEAMALLAPGGRLANRWPRYEQRDEQHRLTAKIAEVLEHGGVLLAEAPTGLGKSLAYLIPTLILARAGKKVVVATCTRSLQDQLYERDLPALTEALGWSVPFVRLKGKQNYVCPRLLEMVEDHEPADAELLDGLRTWASIDSEGDLDRFPAKDPDAFRRLRGRVGADPTACTTLTCRRGRECFWVRARRLAAQAPLLIVNHALLALSGEVEGLLPEFDTLIVDEAHRLEGVLLAQLECSVSRNRFEELLRLVGSGRPGRGGGGLAARLRGFALPLLDAARAEEAAAEMERLTRNVAECRADVDKLFDALTPREAGHPLYGARTRYRSAQELLGQDLDPLEVVLRHCGDLSRTLHRFADQLQVGAPGTAALELSAELEQVSAQWSILGAELTDLGTASERERVYWRSASARGVELHGAPVTAGNHARRLVLGRARAAVLTSATLSSSGDFSFVSERLGLGESWGVPFVTTLHPSPFPLDQQMRTFVHDAGADEAHGIARLVAALARTAPRNQLVLFTAHERLKRARERLRDLLPHGHVLLAQEWDGPAGQLAERFREERGAILLGVQSLWEGVDFPGEALEILVVARLPFSVPDDPVVEARGERLRERGLDPFRVDAVPEAVLRFRQGIGRLIRRIDDRGVLVVCDARLSSASYRKPFLAALPSPPVPCRDPEELAMEAARFLAREVTVEDGA